MCRFANGAMGHLFISRIATGRKMGYAYEIYGTKGSIRFDQEDQNALWLYRAEGPEDRRGFTKILTVRCTRTTSPSAWGRAMARAIRTRSSSRRGISCRPSTTANHAGQPSAMACR